LYRLIAIVKKYRNNIYAQNIKMKSPSQTHTNLKQEIMNKTPLNLLKTLLITGLLLTTLTAVSNNTPSSNTVTNETEKTIRNYFKFPQILLPHYEVKSVQENKVEVLFTTDKTGKVNFVLAKTSDQQLKLEIEKQFSNLLLIKVKQNVVHSVTLNFKTL
jgi:hypothetical protein